ncbi:DUF3473 domain-containing protein [Chloroflexota bacterium]
MINALTIDVEPWHTAELVGKHLPEPQEDQIEEAVRPILDLLDKYGTKATFFMLGIAAEKCPAIVSEIYQKGHEVASHAYSHKTLHTLGEREFEMELKKSAKLLESITGAKPVGFRAPSFSIDDSTRWAFRVLEENGFKYDSSIFPVKTMLYGVPEAPLHPYRPSIADVAQDNPNGKIVEFPLTVLRLGRNIPVAGGFYLRILPLWFLKFAIRRVNKTRAAVIYIHPWETYPGTPRLNSMPLFPRFVTYYGINSALAKLEGLLKEFEFKPLCEFLDS